MSLSRHDNLDNVTGFVMNYTEVVTFPLLPEIRLRVLTEKSEYFYAKESEFAKYGISDPFFLFCWPGGQALSRFVLDNSGLLRGRKVLVFGAGCGVEGIAARLCGAEYVLASDTDPNALVMSSINMKLNCVEFELTEKDFFLSDCSYFDVILAGDMFYDNRMTEQVTGWMRSLKRNGKSVLCADPSRGNLKSGEIDILGTYDTIRDGEIITGKSVKTTVFTIR